MIDLARDILINYTSPVRNSVLSDIELLRKKAGGEIYFINENKYFPGNFPAGNPMEDWPVFRDAVDCVNLVAGAVRRRQLELRVGENRIGRVVGFAGLEIEEAIAGFGQLRVER